jgi:hypothetical protein
MYAKARIEESKTGEIERPHRDWVAMRFKKNARELKAAELYENIARLAR